MKLVSRKFLFCPTNSLCLIALAVSSIIEVSAYYQHNGRYNPEEQDGIPVFSARSMAKMEDDWKGDMQDSMQPRAAMAQRRQADNDLDDGLEEEDEDEYKSGSSPHESIESPSYGESQRFAKDGDEIESFFDTHLGPPKESADSNSDESAEQPTIVRQEMVPAVDPDDYEAAASGPLATIFQSLLGHSPDGHKHTKRPFLQISTSSSTDSDADSEPTTTIKTADKGKEESGLKASQSAQSIVEASSPITLSFRPSGQESMLHEAAAGVGDSYGQTVAPNSGAGTQEIYIGRRPTVMSYLQQQQQQQRQHLSGGYTTSGSANIWRGPNGQPVVYEQEQANDYSRYPVAASYAYQQQPSAAPSEPASSGGQGNDEDEQTVTYGLSFGGGGGAEADETPTSSVHEQEAADPAGSSAETPVEQPQAQNYQTVPYQTPYTTSSTRALNNYYRNYYNGPQHQQTIQGYVRAYPIQPHQRLMMRLPQKRGPSGDLYRQRLMQQNYAKANQGPTRYHRDPSESSNILAAVQTGGFQYDPASYGAMMMQHRGLGGQHRTATLDQDPVQERQRLLADLDREIKASPHYRINQASFSDASATMNSYLNNPMPFGHRQSVSFQKLKKNYLGDDLDTYNSYHSETDPYKTQTTTSRMVNNPLAFLAQAHRQQPASMQQDNGREDNGAGTSNYASNQTPGSSELNNSNQPVQNVSQNGAMQHGAHRQYAGGNLLTGPLNKNYDNSNQNGNQGDLLRNYANQKQDAIGSNEETTRNQGHSRVRRDDSDEREIDNDQDDDGVWVDDDDDDDNRQQSSDVNETSQYPEEEEEEDNQQDDATNNVLTPQQINPPGVIGGPHGYELSPNDLMIYHG